MAHQVNNILFDFDCEVLIQGANLEKQEKCKIKIKVWPLKKYWLLSSNSSDDGPNNVWNDQNLQFSLPYYKFYDPKKLLLIICSI